MSTTRLRFLTLFTFSVILFVVALSTVYAASALVITGVQFDSCNDTSFTAHIDVTYNLEPGDEIRYSSILPDGTYRNSASSLNSIPSPQYGWGVGYSFGSTPYPYTAYVTYRIVHNGTVVDTAEYSIEITCTGLNQGTASVYMAESIGPDRRVNWHHGDLNVAAYSERDNNGDMRLTVYCWDEAAGAASLGFVVTQADVANLTPPSENTLLFEAPQCGASFYYLMSGEFQLNIVTIGGELYELIDTDLNFEDAIRRRL